MNPNDVFPRRNLPDLAEPWGREVEKRIRGVENAAVTTKQSAAGLNRTTAASLEDLARQLRRLQEVYDAIPKPAQSTNTATNFGLGAGWNTVVTASLLVPEGARRVNLMALGSAHLLTQTSPGSPGDVNHRLSFAGVGTSPTLTGAWFLGFDRYEASISPKYTWSATVIPEETISVSLQVDPVSDGIWPSGTGSYAVLALFATFTA